VASERLIHLCFHGIGTPARELEPGESPYWVSEDTYLRFLDWCRGRSDVRISFDDGNASDATIGLEGLLDRGLSATFFVLAGRLGRPGSLGTDELCELNRHGMTIGSHGMHHRPWTGLDEAAGEVEFVEARRMLQEASGSSVDEAALPLGRYDRAVLGRLKELGYSRIYSSDRRWARDGDWFQPRFSVRDGDMPETLWREISSVSGGLRGARAAVTGRLKQLRRVG
jgi:peptidoglycan/xylan/chitin deacetylase (PgdA/CDA1 family)